MGILNLLFRNLINNGKGKFGEYLTESILNNVRIYGKTLHNVYVPYNGRTTEIDVLMVTTKGIIVFESKNYSGWIFGSENQYQWTQCLPNRKRYRFYNPIMQNRTHINALSRYLKINKCVMKSFIVFSERCELKCVPCNTEQLAIVKRKYLLDAINYYLYNQEYIFTCDEVDRITEALIPLTNISMELKNEHIKRINNDYK